MSGKINETVLRTIADDAEFGPRAVKYVEALVEYAACVMVMPFEIAALDASKSALDGEAYREAQQSLDRNRSSKHDRAIASLAALNRMAEKLGLAPVYAGDPHDDHRGDVAHAVFALCKRLLGEDDYGAEWTTR